MLQIVFSHSISNNVQLFCQMANLLGIDCNFVDINDYQSPNDAFADLVLQNRLQVVFDISSIGESVHDFDTNAVRKFVDEHVTASLLLVSDGNPQTVRALRLFVGSSSLDLAWVPGCSGVSFESAAGLNVEPLAGINFPVCESDKQKLVLSGTNGGLTSIMNFAGFSAFAVRRRRTCDIFIWCVSKVIDVDDVVVSERDFEESIHTFVPAFIFLRHAFGSQCWHSGVQRSGIIIDDPLLTKRYGFIDFETLFASARQHGYRVTVAYIPWNHWRSKTHDVQYFIDNNDVFDICVHGCDHINNEYGIHDYEMLLGKSVTAIERLERQKTLTSMSYQPIMVFPQGSFTTEAIRALNDSDAILAAVNSGCLPFDPIIDSVLVGDIMTPAMDRFEGFPVFKRRYPFDITGLALDIFLGKPALIVTHHDFFREGLPELEKLVAFIRTSSPDTTWSSLTEVVQDVHLRRFLPNGSLEIRFFTSSFRLQSEIDWPPEFLARKRIPSHQEVSTVTVNGKPVDYQREGEFLFVPVRTERSTPMEIDVKTVSPKAIHRYDPGPKYRFGVLTRRSLSEIRDNVFARSPKVLQASQWLVDQAGLTSKSRQKSPQS